MNGTETEWVEQCSEIYENSGRCFGDACKQVCGKLFGLFSRCVDGLVSTAGATVRYATNICREIVGSLSGLNRNVLEEVSL